MCFTARAVLATVGFLGFFDTRFEEQVTFRLRVAFEILCGYVDFGFLRSG